MSVLKWPPHDAMEVPADLLPQDWIDSIHALVRENAKVSELRGDGPTGREEPDTAPMQVKVVEGNTIKTSLPWLWSLYEGHLLNFCSIAANKPLFIAQDVVSSININHLEGDGARYERHVDSNPLTGLLFASTLDERCGGQLIFEHPDTRAIVSVAPTAGQFICFDAREIVHWVAPLHGNITRVSIPMNYYENAFDQYRPPGLDEKLYA